MTIDLDAATSVLADRSGRVAEGFDDRRT